MVEEKCRLLNKQGDFRTLLWRVFSVLIYYASPSWTNGLFLLQTKALSFTSQNSIEQILFLTNNILFPTHGRRQYMRALLAILCAI